jgi:hypothetical protein
MQTSRSKTLLPSTLATLVTALPERAARTLTNVSGTEVPAATTVMPHRKLGVPKAWPSPMAARMRPSTPIRMTSRALNRIPTCFGTDRRAGGSSGSKSIVS